MKHIRFSNKLKTSEANPMTNLTLSNDELYEFVKLYDILRDMDFELTPNQTNVFDKILFMEANPNV